MVYLICTYQYIYGIINEKFRTFKEKITLFTLAFEYLSQVQEFDIQMVIATI